MDITTQGFAPTVGQQITVTILPGHATERTVSGRLFELYGTLVIQPASYMSDEFLTIVLRDGSINPNLRIDSIA